MEIFQFRFETVGEADKIKRLCQDAIASYVPRNKLDDTRELFLDFSRELAVWIYDHTPKDESDDIPF